MLLEHHEQEKHAKALLGLIINRSKTIFSIHGGCSFAKKNKNEC